MIVIVVAVHLFTHYVWNFVNTFLYQEMEQLLKVDTIICQLIIGKKSQDGTPPLNVKLAYTIGTNNSLFYSLLSEMMVRDVDVAQ